MAVVERVGGMPKGAGRFRILRTRPLLLGIAIAVAVGILIVSRTQLNMVYYKTVAEVLNSGTTLNGREIRVMGRVQDGSIVQGGQIQQLAFELTDGTGSIPVHYQGAVPSLFGYANEGRYQDVVVEGRYDRRGNLISIAAQQLIVAHGSKYQAAAPAGIPATAR